MRNDILERKNDIQEWTNSGIPNAEIARKLNCKVDTLKTYCKKMGVVLKPNPGRRGMKHYEQRISIVDYLNGNSSNSSKRRRLIEDGLKENRCEYCGLSEWNGKPIPLELHHKDFNHYNNSLDNLVILCSNCHMQAHNYNNQSAQEEILEVECRKFKEALTGNADGNLEPSLSKEEGAETRHDTPKE